MQSKRLDGSKFMLVATVSEPSPYTRLGTGCRTSFADQPSRTKRLPDSRAAPDATERRRSPPKLSTLLTRPSLNRCWQTRLTPAACGRRCGGEPLLTRAGRRPGFTSAREFAVRRETREVHRPSFSASPRTRISVSRTVLPSRTPSATIPLAGSSGPLAHLLELDHFQPVGLFGQSGPPLKSSVYCGSPPRPSWRGMNPGESSDLPRHCWDRLLLPPGPEAWLCRSSRARRLPFCYEPRLALGRCGKCRPERNSRRWGSGRTCGRDIAHAHGRRQERSTDRVDLFIDVVHDESDGTAGFIARRQVPRNPVAITCSSR